MNGKRQFCSLLVVGLAFLCFAMPGAGARAGKEDKESKGDDASLQKVQEFFAKFGKGDIPGVLDTLSEDVDWFIPGPATIPYAGARKGRTEAGKFFTSFSDAVEVQKFEPRQFVTQKGQVVVLGHE